MESLISVTEGVYSAEQVLLPNRYQRPFVDAYQNITNIEVPELKDRKMSAISQGILFRWIRGRDIPQVVELATARNPNICTIGLTGSEWCREYDYSTQSGTSLIWDEMSYERIGKVSLIASANSDISIIRSQLNDWSRPVQVVTAYPNLIRGLRKDRKFNITSDVSISGGVEGVADMLGMVAVDLVSKGKTIASNNFVIVQELLESYPALVRSNSRKKEYLVCQGN